MKRSALYSLLAATLAVVAVFTVATGLWLYLLRSVPTPTLTGWLEIAAVHLLGMGAVGFTLLHLLLVSKDDGGQGKPFRLSIALFAVISVDIAASLYGENIFRTLLAVLTFATFSGIATLLAAKATGAK